MAVRTVKLSLFTSTPVSVAPVVGMTKPSLDGPEVMSSRTQATTPRMPQAKMSISSRTAWELTERTLPCPLQHIATGAKARCVPTSAWPRSFRTRQKHGVQNQKQYRTEQPVRQANPRWSCTTVIMLPWAGWRVAVASGGRASWVVQADITAWIVRGDPEISHCRQTCEKYQGVFSSLVESPTLVVLPCRCGEEVWLRH